MNTVCRSGVPGRDDYWLALYFSRSRLVLVLLAGLALWGVSAWACGSANASLLVKATALVGMGFFSAGVLFCAYRLLRRTPALIVDQVGVHDHASLAAVGTIPWSNVRGAAEDRCFGQRVFTVSVRDPRAVVRGVRGPRRLIVAANAHFGGGPVNIPAVLLPNGLSTAKFGIAIHHNAFAAGTVRTRDPRWHD